MRKRNYEEILGMKPSVSKVKKMKRNQLFAVLDNVRSMYNVGAIFRTSDAVLLGKCYLCGITACPPRDEISKTALGSEDLVPWEYRDEAVDAVKEMKKQGVKVFAVELAEGSVQYDKMEIDGPVCFVFGHEVEGISDEVMAECDAAIEIPMLGRANSLNVATCYGIIMYEALKKLKNV